ncbi:contractile injection system protein, VgrG/Pvc8 family [Pseudomonas sp. LB3P31]
MSTKFTNEYDVHTFDHNLCTLSVNDLDTYLAALCFHGDEQLSQPFTYCIEFTAVDLDLAAKKILNRTASFSLFSAGKPKIVRGFNIPEFNPLRTVYGLITGFNRLSASINAARYEVTLQPRLALLDRGQQYRIYTPQSVDANTRRDRVQEWQRFLEDADEHIAAQSAHHPYGGRSLFAQTFLKGDDVWAGGKSWHWRPAVADTVNELKGIS